MSVLHVCCCCLLCFCLFLVPLFLLNFLIPKRWRRSDTDVSVTTTQQHQQEEEEEEDDDDEGEGEGEGEKVVHPCLYDVFLSFRGVDTRNTFTNFLHTLLVQKEIKVFIDEEELRKGEEISSALVKAIRDSKISIIIFSENYASSRWCLDELVHILECRESNKQLVWPIFYKVDPSVVRYQSGKYGKALAKHEGRFNQDKVQRWRTALKDAANLSGWTFMDGHEKNFINKIVKDISAQVSKRTYLNVAKYLVGIEHRVQEMMKLLDVKESDVRMVGTCGMGGIGKTTIAKAVYNEIAHKFEGCCFLEIRREESVRLQGLVGLQNILLSEIIGQEKTQKMKLTNVYRGINVIKKILHNKRVLLVLDDVLDLNHLCTLAGDTNWFGRGSRIIITTRDKHLLDVHQVYSIYRVRPLNIDEACKLLRLNVFKDNRNSDEFPIRAVLAYNAGHPLAINIVGSLLYGKSIDQWHVTLDSFKRISHDVHVQNILEISYTALEYPLREAFLDVACLLQGSHKSFVMRVLEGSGLINPLHTIKQLEDKAFIYTDEDGHIWMHGLLEGMGKEIVLRESPNDPSRRSRLWFHKDVYRVLTENIGTAEIRGILVKLPKEEEIYLGAECFEKMPNLEIFININARFVGEGIRYLPNKLRRDLPLMSESDPQKLVMLDIMNSTSSRLFQGYEKFHNLKDVSISNCESLAEFLVLPGMFPKVKSLRLTRCSNLVEFPRIVHMKSLKSLYVGNCERLENFLEIGGRMKSLISLKISRTAIKQIPSSIGYDLVNLELFSVTECENLSYLPRSLYDLQHTKVLFVFQCPNMTLLEEKIAKLANSNEISLDNCYGPLSITKSDDDQGNLLLPSVCEIWLSGTAIVTLPVVFSKFGQVTKLELVNCLMLQ